MRRPEKSFTLITGASLGIGKAMAEVCAERQQNLALVALPDEGLGEFAEYLEHTYRVEVRWLEIDLAGVGGPEEVWEWTLEEAMVVSILINNAGFGQLGSFLEYDQAYYERMTRVNLNATLILTRLFLEPMKARNFGFVLNVGSAASFFPMPYKSVYSASKAFVYYLSRAIQHELRHSKVHLCVLCPNGVPTNEETAARVQQMGIWGRASVVNTETVARMAIKAMLSRQKVVIPGRFNRFSHLMSKIFPERFSMIFMDRQFRRQERLGLINPQSIEMVPVPTKEPIP